MTKVVFPTQENLSYISTVENSFYQSKYLTVLHCKGQSIDGVDILLNPCRNDLSEFASFCKEKHFNVLVSIDSDKLPLEDLDCCGISVYNAKKSKIILYTFSDFVQDKLEKII